jgi:oleate hydratase
LSILNGLDITGYYQYEYLYLPIFFFLQSCGVDIRFGTEVKNIEIAQNNNQRIISGLHLIHDEVESHTSLGKNDIVLVNLGSTTSGSAIGTNDVAPMWQSINADDMLDQNWSVWLDLGNQHRDFGDPYNFCTRQSESMLESFTITTGDLGFFDNLRAFSRCTSEAGAFIFLEASRWKINLCIPSQPVFPDQPRNVRVLWGLAHSPECEGNYVNKPMLQCPGTDIMAELLGHLNLHYQAPMSSTITIPRAMPRMSAMLLTRAPSDRPRAIPQAFSNVGLVGHFAEIPQHTCVDVSYGIRSAQMAVSGLMGFETPIEPLTSTVSTLQKIIFWR